MKRLTYIGILLLILVMFVFTFSAAIDRATSGSGKLEPVIYLPIISAAQTTPTKTPPPVPSTSTPPPVPATNTPPPVPN